MKVLVIHCVYQYKGGEETVVEEEIKLLRSKGVQVEDLLFNNNGNTFMKTLLMPFNMSAYWLTRKKLKEFKPDLVHIHNLHFGASPSVIYAVKRSKIPCVCTLHNFRLLCPSGSLCYNGKLFLSSLKSSFPWKAVKTGVYRNSHALTFLLALSMQIHRWAGTWKLPDFYIVLNNHTLKIFNQSKVRFRDGQFVIKPNFCTVPEYTTVKRTDEFMYVGRLTAEKGVPLLLKVFSSSPHKLIIAGEGELTDEVIAFASKFSNIRYAGSLTKQELIPLLSCVSALVFPSVWYEGMPLTIIEAFACSTPVIATRLGAMELMITSHYNGLLFETGNEKDLRRALDEWTGLSATEKDRYYVNARDTYERQYTPEKNAELLLNIYNSAIKKKLANPKTSIVKELKSLYSENIIS